MKEPQPQPLNLKDIKKEDIIAEAIVESFRGKKWDEKVPLGNIHLLALELFEKEIKQRIKLACEFYMKYMNKPELLIREHPKYRDEVDKMFSDSGITFVARYNRWLFKLTFKDIIRGA